MSTYTIKLDNVSDDAVKSVQGLLDAAADHHIKEIEKVAAEYGIQTGAAADVVYLRTRSRWTEELERKLIDIYKAGGSVNIMEWPAR